MRTERWVPKEDAFEAVRLTRENLEEAAKWCGGEIGTRTHPVSIDDAYDTVLRFPTLDGPEEAAIGDYLIRKSDGKFDFWPESAMLAKYKKVGLRQDGWQTKPGMRGGSIGGPASDLPPYTINNSVQGEKESQGEYMTRMGW